MDENNRFGPNFLEDAAYLDKVIGLINFGLDLGVCIVNMMTLLLLIALLLWPLISCKTYNFTCDM